MLAVIGFCEGVKILEGGYSGRFMYGKKCFAFEAENPIAAFGEILDCINRLYNDTDDIYEELDELMKSAKTDNLGMNMVVYFPFCDWNSEE